MNEGDLYELWAVFEQEVAPPGVPNLDREVRTAMAVAPTPTVVQPGEAEFTLLPYQKQHRVAEVLLGLEAAVATFLSVHPDVLVCLEGSVGSKGYAAIFEQRTGPAEQTIARHVAAKWEHGGRPYVVAHQAPEIAFQRFRIFSDEVA